MSAIPLKDICEIKAGQSAPQDPAAFSTYGTPFIRAGSLERLVNGNSEHDFELITEENGARHRLKLFPKDTIIFAKSGMSAKLGRVHRLRTPSYVVSHLAAIIPGEKVYPSYLQRWFEKNPPSRLIPNEAYPSIKLSEIGMLKIDLPPLHAQRRIAAILDKADAIRRKRRQAIMLADEFLWSVFLDMFGDPMTNPKGWPKLPLGKLIIGGPQNGLYRPAQDYGSGTQILRIDSFYDGKISGLNTLKRVRIDNQTINKYKLHVNDIVINRVNSRKFLGKNALVEKLIETTVYESNMMRFSVNENLIKPKRCKKFDDTSPPHRKPN